MGKENKSYRIRTNVDSDSVVSFSVDNSVTMLDVLSLSINQTNTYKLMNSETGIIVGRVLANGGLGIPNAKVSVFIGYEDTNNISERIMYHFTTTKDIDYNGIRYNLLPNSTDNDCHQDVGTFPNKRVVLDNNSWIDIFDKYYTYTTRTNNAGDYMIYGIPTGMHTVHIDVDLSDIGILSQKPIDLMYKGYNANMFDSASMFKKDTNIDSLAQIITQDKSVYVYPFWGDTSDTNLNASITRCDLNLNYKFEPTCVFMGSIITDMGENALSKRCVASKKQGKMSDMITGEGKIEMIRKTVDGQIEQFSINGNKNINSDGVWCYQIPMNLDYIVTDEFGKTVMSDNPNIGLATRTSVRFRLSMSETISDVTARKRARFLIPNNPRLSEDDYPVFSQTKEIDYEFGSKTKDENFRDLMWNNVYTVKSYIPRIQKNRQPNNLKFLGVKMVNHSNGNNPMPFNNLRIKFNFMYMFMCTIMKVFVTLTRSINTILSWIAWVFYKIGEICCNISNDVGIVKRLMRWFASYNNQSLKEYGGMDTDQFVKEVNNYIDSDDDSGKTGGLANWFMKIFLKIGCGIKLDNLCESDDGTDISVTPGAYDKTKNKLRDLGIDSCDDDVSALYNCIENQLAQENEVTSFNFYNDWINGVVYLPLWYRKIRPRRRGVIKDVWCSTDNTTVRVRKYKKRIKVYGTNVLKRGVTSPTSSTMGVITPLTNNENTAIGSSRTETGGESIMFTSINDENCYGYKCHKYSRDFQNVYKGLIYQKETMLGDYVYYYKPCDYDPLNGVSDLITLFATDIVLLGSLNSCDIHGVPQFFKCLESTTYNMPPDLMTEYNEYIDEDNVTTTDENDSLSIDNGTRVTEYTGADWGDLGADQSNYRLSVLDYSITDSNKNIYDNGGLFYGLTCFDSYTKPKSCINLSRICEVGVSLDESLDFGDELAETLIPDGFVSYDEIYNPDYRSMFATLNSNFLRTKINQNNGLTEYDFDHLYIDNFDGSLKNLMMAKTVRGYTEKSGFTEQATYVGNYKLENSSDAYLNFRFGNYIKNNGKKIYYYDDEKVVGRIALGTKIMGGNRMPRYENSFYFYFGLNEGKTAIDKFNSEFFSDCTKNIVEAPYTIEYMGNSWCPIESNDGFIAIDMNAYTPILIEFTNKETGDKYINENIDHQKFLFGTKPIDAKYSTYTVYTLDVIYNTNMGATTNTVNIIPSGEYTIKIIDGNDNVYTNNISFSQPYIAFTCNVSPFNCKNVELMERFGGNGISMKTMFTNIANNGSFKDNPSQILYSKYDAGSIIEQGTTYYRYFSFGSNGIYIPTIAITTIFVTENSNCYYHHEPRINRDTSGYFVISGVTEDDFKIDITPLNTQFFGDNYIGVSIEVHISSGGSVSVTELNTDGVGYLGWAKLNEDIQYYFGLPYGGERYLVTLTQLCYDENTDTYVDSENVTHLNTILYEDEFKLYINGIDYDIIRNFKTGWDDTELVNGEFKNNGNDSTFTSANIYGWNNIFNIGKYIDTNNNLVNIEPITYDTNINDVISICDVLSPSYTENGSGSTQSTPYCWTNVYCYIKPDILDTNINNGQIDLLIHTYTIIPRFTIAENTIIYDYYGNTVEYYDMSVGVTYYTDENHTNVAVEGEDYTVSNVLYDSNGNEVTSDNINQNEIYYLDQECTNVAILDVDYIDNVTYYNVSVTRVDSIKEYEAYSYDVYLANGDIYYIKNGDTYVENIVTDTYISVSDLNNGDTVYYKLEEIEYYSEYVTIDNIVVATEDNYGNITYDESGNYSSLDCATYYEYRTIIDEINTIIEDRIEFTRNVAGEFRICNGETMLELGVVTKSKPVNYLICGNKETILDTYLYNNTPQSITPSVIQVATTDRTVQINRLEIIKTVDNAYTVDANYETNSVSFSLPTLTINNLMIYDKYTDTHNGNNKHPYYVSVKNYSNSVIPSNGGITNYSNTNKDITSMFGVHFYNKPLHTYISKIFSYVYEMPTYPKQPLQPNTTWRPTDVTMPGFMAGYLYNGIPIDDNASNIVATFDGNYIDYVTLNADTYQNIKVRRLIYTNYDTTDIKPYGEYKLENGSDMPKYQYVEVPYSESDLVYSDGYGTDTIVSINGTIRILFDNTEFTYSSNDDIVTLTSNDVVNQITYYLFDFDDNNFRYPFDYGNGSTDILKYNTNSGLFYFETMPDLLKNIGTNNMTYSKSTISNSFNITKYREDNPNSNRFFVMGYNNGYVSISPVFEYNRFRIIYNYNGYDGKVYITARESRSDDKHYVEDFYYMQYYSFTVYFKIYDATTNEFGSPIYSKTFSIKDGTATKVDIQVTDNDESVTYDATAICINLSDFGTIESWYSPFIEDHTGILRLASQQTGNVIVTEQNN